MRLVVLPEMKALNIVLIIVLSALASSTAANRLLSVEGLAASLNHLQEGRRISRIEYG